MKKIIATSGLLTYVLLVNSGIVSAQDIGSIAASDTVERPRISTIRHEQNFDKKLTTVASKLNLDPEELRKDARKGKTIRQILKARGINTTEINRVLGNKRGK